MNYSDHTEYWHLYPCKGIYLIYLVRYIWLIMEESGVFFVLRVFVGLKRIIEAIFYCVCNNIISLSQFTLLNTGLSRKLFSEILLTVGEIAFQ